MANIAILGSSFSAALYRNKDENEMQKLPWSERIPLTSRTPDFITEDNENHWVNLLEKKYPQHTFCIFAKGGSGWEYAQQVLHMLSEKTMYDRVIVELCDYRAIILSQDIAFKKLNIVKKLYQMPVKHYIPNPNPENYMP